MKIMNLLAINNSSAKIRPIARQTIKGGLMGLTIITALEIFTNPYDLEISIGHEKGGKRHIIAFTCGPGHNFKPLITSDPFNGKHRDAVKTVKATLTMIHEAMKKEFADPKSMLSERLNPGSQEIDQSKILTPDLIKRIIKKLQDGPVAKTYEMTGATG